MARCAIFASGTGSNFVCLAEKVAHHPEHAVSCLVCDKPNAAVVEKAFRLGITIVPALYTKNSNGKIDRHKTEIAIIERLQQLQVDCIALAGYMRIITPTLLKAFPDRIMNIHPSLLPKHPGAKGMQESIASGDTELGITIHYVDEGVDTGPIITQRSFHRRKGETAEQEEKRIHALEHEAYPEVLINVMNDIQRGEKR